MEKQKEEVGIPEEKFVKWFPQLTKDSKDVAGGKGANLAEIYNKSIPVPPGFVVTAQAYDYFIEKAGIKQKINEFLEGIDYEDTEKLDDRTEKIRKMISEAKMPEEMRDEIIESYDHLGASEYDIDEGDALEILNKAKEPVFTAVRSSATAEDLADASFAGQQESFLNVKGNDKLIQKIKECFASLFTSRATYYRSKKDFKHSEASIAVVVQKMVNAEKSGVMFSKDPNSNTENVVIEAVFGLGEGIVSGQITPDKYEVSKGLEVLDKKVANKKTEITRNSSGENISRELRPEKSKHQVLNNHEIKRAAEYALELEEHYGKPQDIEFSLEEGEMYIVQTRPVTTIDKDKKQEEHNEIDGEQILEGLSASEGVAVGKVKIVHTKEDLSKIQKGDILVTEMTNPDMVVAMQRSSAVLTDKGGLTAHAAIVSREMGIPCIVGSEDATSALQDGDKITIDAYNGKVYRGEVAEEESKSIEPVEEDTETEIKVINDIPSSAERSAKTGLRKVGLTRLEGIIAESGKHPNYFIENDDPKGYEEVIYNGVKEIGKHFKEMWIRTSDIRTDEYNNLEGAPKEPESNPMLGMHGIRFSIQNPKIFKAELNALKRVSEEEGTKVGLLLPQVINVNEVQETKKALSEIGFENAKVGVMVETPASIQIIKDLCEEGIDFVSFGTNDLTQYILAIDRGNEKLQHLYEEMHPSVINQMSYVIRVCKRNKIETSICGQAGSRKDMAKFLVEKGIDSISVNADKAKEISEYVAETEQEVLGKKGQLPRQYEKRKEKEAEQQENSKSQKEETKENKDISEKPKEASEVSYQEEAKNLKEQKPNESLSKENSDQYEPESQEKQEAQLEPRETSEEISEKNHEEESRNLKEQQPTENSDHEIDQKHERTNHSLGDNSFKSTNFNNPQNEKEDRSGGRDSFRPTRFNSQQNEKEDRLRKNDVFPQQEESKNLEEQDYEPVEGYGDDEEMLEKQTDPESPEDQNETTENPEETGEDLLKNTGYADEENQPKQPSNNDERSEKENDESENPRFESPF
ncbi:MAG: phosphoenolpyruvate synthase [Candidatus Pacearchaeota archaeon]